MRRLVVGLALLVCACGGGGADSSSSAAVVGRVEVTAGIPATECAVTVVGTPLGCPCDENGGFRIEGIPKGTWDLKVSPGGNLQRYASRRVAVGLNAGLTTNVGAIALFLPGAIGGEVFATNQSDILSTIIGVSEAGVVGLPNANGTYLLPGVPPGQYDVVTLAPNGSIFNPGIAVAPKEVTDLDIHLSGALLGDGTIIGRAFKTNGTSTGLQVSVLDALNGTAVAETEPSTDGSFSFQRTPGAYVVRVTEPGNPITSSVPYIFLATAQTFDVGTLVVAAFDSDIDNDGKKNPQDDDADGDGVPNGDDAFPYDPENQTDADGDGLGDENGDLDSDGEPGVDPPLDGDGDAWPDAFDNCPGTSNFDQTDNDDDGFGDACDNCPDVANPDQDADACAVPGACDGVSCGAGLICNPSDGMCVDCLGNADCDGGELCHVQTHDCVECLGTGDCDMDEECLNFECQPESGGPCQSDVECDEAYFCVSGTCEPRTTNFDAGAGRYVCTVTCDCKTGEICDGSHCQPDVITKGNGQPFTLVPDRYVNGTGTGDGLTPGAPAGVLPMSSGTAQLVAISGTFLNGATFVSTGVRAIAGGYSACSFYRWVRDPASYSQIGAISLSGNPTPIPDAVVVGLEPGGATCSPVSAASASGFTAHHLKVIQSNACSTASGISCDTCSQVRITDLVFQSQATALSATVDVVSLIGASGFVGDVNFITSVPSALSTYRLVRIQNSNGVEVDGVSMSSMATLGRLIDIDNSDNVSLSNLSLPINASGSATPQTIYISQSDNFTLADSTLFAGSVAGTDDSATALTLVASDGAVARTTISARASDYFVGILVQNIGNTVDLDEVTVIGDSHKDSALLKIDNASGSLITVTDSTFSMPVNASVVRRRRGIEVLSSTGTGGLLLDVADSVVSFTGTATAPVAGDNPRALTSFAFESNSSSPSRFVRTRLIAGPIAGSDGADSLTTAAAVTDDNVDIVSSFLYGGTISPNGTRSSYGLWLDGPADVRVAASTIDAAGGMAADSSTGIKCQGTPNTFELSSSVVGGGSGLNHFMLEADPASACLTVGNHKNNYYWYSAIGGPSAGEDAGSISSGTPNMPDVNGNMVGNATTCYQSGLTQPAFDLALTGPCINRGLNSVNGLPAITSDINGNTRPLGGTADVGCQERQ